MVAELKPTPEQYVEWTKLRDSVTGATLEVALVYVTVELAFVWLQRNVNFRKRKPRAILRYADMMLRGLWENNGETIKFYASGDLKDGQNRLEACIQAGVPFVALVVRGIQSDLHVDEGERRTLAEILESRGETYSKDLAAALRLVFKWENGKITDTAFTGATEDHLATLARHPDVRRSVVNVKNATRERLIEPSAGAFLHYTLARKHTSEAADKFFDAFLTGAGAGAGELGKQDPIFQLRHRLTQAKERKDKRMTKLEKMVAVMKAWNLWINGKPCPSGNSLRWRQYGPTAEPFPVHFITPDTGENE